jgi:hypothetical protein
VRTCRNLPTVTGILLDATGLDRFLGRYRLLRFAMTGPTGSADHRGLSFHLQAAL